MGPPFYAGISLLWRSSCALLWQKEPGESLWDPPGLWFSEIGGLAFGDGALLTGQSVVSPPAKRMAPRASSKVGSVEG